MHTVRKVSQNYQTENQIRQAGGLYLLKFAKMTSEDDFLLRSNLLSHEPMAYNADDNS